MAKSGVRTPAAPKPPRAVKAASEVVAAPKVEKKKPAPVSPVVDVPAPAAQEPAATLAAAKSVETPVEAVEAIVEPIAEAVAQVAEDAPAAPATAEMIEEAETIAPVAAEPTRIFEKELFMTVDPKNLFADFNDRAKAAMEKSARAVEELNDFAKGNVEALVESSKITAKGLEVLGQEAAEYSRRSFESATAALKSLSAVKSPTDFFKLQSDYMRGAFDSYVAEASKTTEAMIKLAGEAAQPISNRVALAAEKVKVAA